MKLLITLILTATAVLPSLGAPKNLAAKAFDGKAYQTSEALDLTDSTESEINDYYSYDTTSQYKGEALRSRLYDIISQDNYFIDYNTGVTKWYKITDRNWSISQTVDPSSYKFTSDTGNNYFLNLVYFEDSANNDTTKAINTDVNGFKKDTTISGVDWTNEKRANAYLQVDKEHVWAKSHGFPPQEGKDPVKGAGTDLHHLMAADHNTNSAAHNDLFYGKVVTHDSTTEKYCYYADGTRAVSGWTGNDKNGNKVFEPTDEWKGDIARALLYMSIRYSSYQENNTESEPYIVLTDDLNAKDNFITKDNLDTADEESTAQHYHGVHIGLSTYLEWNNDDPVSEYEKHRNNLIYKNVQKNRNPLVDHPEWADEIFHPENYPDLIDDTEVDTTKTDFSGLKDSYNARVNQKINLGVRIGTEDQETIASYDANLIKFDNNGTVTPLKTGTATITFTNSTTTVSTTIEIKDEIQTKEASLSLEKGKSDDSYKISDPDLFSDETLNYTSSDTSIATFDNGTIKAIKAGSCKLTTTVESTRGKLTYQTISLTVTDSSSESSESSNNTSSNTSDNTSGNTSNNEPTTPSLPFDTKTMIIIGVIALVVIILLAIFMPQIFRKKRIPTPPSTKKGHKKSSNSKKRK